MQSPLQFLPIHLSDGFFIIKIESNHNLKEENTFKKNVGPHGQTTNLIGWKHSQQYL